MQTPAPFTRAIEHAIEANRAVGEAMRAEQEAARCVATHRPATAEVHFQYARSSRRVARMYRAMFGLAAAQAAENL